MKFEWDNKSKYKTIFNKNGWIYFELTQKFYSIAAPIRKCSRSTARNVHRDINKFVYEKYKNVVLQQDDLFEIKINYF